MDEPQKLTDSTTDFQTLFERATIGILVIDEDGQIVLLNSCSENLFGYARKELVGKPLEILIPETLRNKHISHRNDYFKKPKPRFMGQGLTLSARKKDGTEFPVEVSLNDYCENGNHFFVAYITDITERKINERNLRQSENYRSLVLEGMHESFRLYQVVRNKNSEISELQFIDINPAAEKFHQRPKEEIVGHLRSEFSGSLTARQKEILKKVADNKEQIEYDYFHEPDHRWYHVSTYSPQKDLVAVFTTDITEKKVSEEKFSKVFYKGPTPKIISEYDTGTIIDVNDSFIQFSGYSREELIGKKAVDVGAIRANDRKTWIQMMQRDGRLSDYEIEFTTKNGRKSYASLSAELIEIFGVKYLMSSCIDITEKKRLNEKIISDEQRIRLLIEHTPAAVAMFDREMNYLIVSKRWLKDYHLEDQHVIGRNHYDVFPELDPHLKEIHQRCLAGETIRKDEDQFVRADGTLEWLQWEVAPWHDYDSHVGGIIIFSEIITKRKQAEEQIARELEQTKRLQVISNRIIEKGNIQELYNAILDASMELMQSDFASIQLFDPEKNELHLLAYRNFHPDSAAHWQCVRADDTTSCSHALSTHTRAIVKDVEHPPFEINREEYHYFHLSGIASMQSTLLTSREGNYVGMISTHWRKPHEPTKREFSLFDVLARQAADLIEQMQFQINLKLAEERYRTIYEGTEEAIYLMDVIKDDGFVKDLRFIDVNPSALKAMGKDILQVKGRLASEVSPALWDDENKSQITRALNGEIVTRVRYLGQTGSWRESKTQILTNGLMMTVTRDVTRQKEAEQEQKRINQMLEEKVQLRTKELVVSLEREKELNELKSRFVSMASHEFRTPLSIVLSSISLIEYQMRDQDDFVKKHIARIKSSVNDLTAILGDFLSLDKLEQGKVEINWHNIEIDQFIKKLIEEADLVKRKGQTLIAVHSGKTTARTDPNKLSYVLVNLISNAVKYSSEDKPIHITSSVGDGLLTISVQDFGIGVPEEEQKNLFDKFFRARNAATIQGTGLGLNIAKRYVELLCGSIRFESKINEGSTFIVQLPQS